MNIKYRKLIYRVPLLYSLCLEVRDVVSGLCYLKLRKQGLTIDSLRLKNKFQGKRCFIIGNGPSLNAKDLDMLKDEDCFGANLIFKIFNQTEWRPKFYCIQDRYARIGDFLSRTKIEYVLVGDYYWSSRPFSNSHARCFHTKRVSEESEVPFSWNAEKYIYDAATITYSMIQLAVYMGYKEIYLLGIDHNYPNFLDNKHHLIHQSGAGHFFKDEYPAEVVANIVMMERAYEAALRATSEHGISIYNATRGGNLEIFKRVKLEDIVMINR